MVHTACRRKRRSIITIINIEDDEDLNDSMQQWGES